MTLRSRMARPDDYPHFVRLSGELGSGDPLPERERWVAEVMPTTLVFEDGVDVVGYTFVQPLEQTGYVRHVVLGPTHRGRRLGTVVMAAAAEYLRAHGCVDWCLNVRPNNTPAVRLYERCGMRAHHRSQSILLPWTILSQLPREAHGVTARTIEASDDAVVEATFDLPRGQLASHRARAGRVLVGLHSAEAADPWVAMACFDPRFPGAGTFRVQRPELAGPLLEAFRPTALPEHEQLRVMVEADEALAALLFQHGGKLIYDVTRMAGPLPPQLTV